MNIQTTDTSQVDEPIASSRYDPATVPVALIEHTVAGSIEYSPLRAAYKLPMGVRFELCVVPVASHAGDGKADHAAAGTPPISDQRLQEWADRHGIRLSGSDLRSAVDDAATLHLLSDSPGTCGPAASPSGDPAVDTATWKFDALYGDTEVRSTTDDKLLAVVCKGTQQRHMVHLLKSAAAAQRTHVERVTPQGVASQSTAQPITMAMHEWCARLSNSTRCRWIKSRETSSDVTCRGSGSYGGPTYVFADKMLSAGLIRYERKTSEFGTPGLDYEWVAVLTDAGVAAAAAKSKGRQAMARKT